MKVNENYASHYNAIWVLVSLSLFKLYIFNTGTLDYLATFLFLLGEAPGFPVAAFRAWSKS